MAEVQTSPESGEMTQQFIEFVMMQAQNAAMFLGQLPHPSGGEPEVNLDLSKLFIDQLVMIRAKTRGNLSTEELGVLNNAISNLQMAFFEVSQGARGASAGPGSSTAAAPAEVVAPDSSSAPPSEAAPAAEPPSESETSRKKFTKSYGA